MPIVAAIGRPENARFLPRGSALTQTRSRSAEWTDNCRSSPEALLFVFPFGYGLDFCAANFRKEGLSCGRNRHLAQ